MCLYPFRVWYIVFVLVVYSLLGVSKFHSVSSIIKFWRDPVFSYKRTDFTQKELRGFLLLYFSVTS